MCAELNLPAASWRPVQWNRRPKRRRSAGARRTATATPCSSEALRLRPAPPQGLRPYPRCEAATILLRRHWLVRSRRRHACRNPEITIQSRMGGLATHTSAVCSRWHNSLANGWGYARAVQLQVGSLFGSRAGCTTVSQMDRAPGGGRNCCGGGIPGGGIPGRYCGGMPYCGMPGGGIPDGGRLCGGMPYCGGMPGGGLAMPGGGMPSPGCLSDTKLCLGTCVRRDARCVTDSPVSAFGKALTSSVRYDHTDEIDIKTACQRTTSVKESSPLGAHQRHCRPRMLHKLHDLVVDQALRLRLLELHVVVPHIGLHIAECVTPHSVQMRHHT